MLDTPTGAATPDDEIYVPVAELAKAAGYSSRHIYLLADKDPVALPLDPQRRGIRWSAATAWLKSRSRNAKKAARAEMARRLRALGQATGTKEGGHDRPT